MSQTEHRQNVRQATKICESTRVYCLQIDDEHFRH